MKKILILYFCYFLLINADAQTPTIDSLHYLLATTKDDTTKVKILATLSWFDPSFDSGLDLAWKGLALARKIKYRKGEAQCLNQIGNQYVVISNYVVALRYYLQSLQIREEINDRSGVAVSNDNIGFVYKKLGDIERAKSYFLRAYQIQSAIKDNHGLAITNADLGSLYELTQELDSALFHYQRSYECFHLAQDQFQLAMALNGLGSVHRQLGNKDLAMGYYRLAINNGREYNDSLNLPESFLGMAILFKDISQPDSSILYAKKALKHAKTANVQDVVVHASKLLSQLFQNGNDEEALKYMNIAIEASDSTFSRAKLYQIQNLSFLEQERQREIAQQKLKEAAERKHMLQYAAIAIGCMSFIMLFILFSRSIIANPKLIRFFGVIALLIVFEFLNLLLHPFLGSLTHHSPFLMLLAMVCIAALLVPLHHKIEHWVTHQLVEKNNKMRLRAAKRIIEQLDEKNDSLEGKDSKHLLP